MLNWEGTVGVGITDEDETDIKVVGIDMETIGVKVPAKDLVVVEEADTEVIRLDVEVTGRPSVDNRLSATRRGLDGPGSSTSYCS